MRLWRAPKFLLAAFFLFGSGHIADYHLFPLSCTVRIMTPTILRMYPTFCIDLLHVPFLYIPSRNLLSCSCLPALITAFKQITTNRFELEIRILYGYKNHETNEYTFCVYT